MPEWHVALSVCGPISTSRKLSFNVEKGYQNPFWTTVTISRLYNGVRIEVTARASDRDEANEAGLFFVGQTLDLLALRLNLPLTMFLADSQSEIKTVGAKRIVELHDWEDVFRTARDYGLTRPAFSRSISWFRKGLETNNPVDRFMSFWTAIESLASHCARRNDRTRQGIINQVCDCFDQLWGASDNWRVIPGRPEYINRLNGHRNTIAHGAVAIQVDQLKAISLELPTLHNLAHQFLMCSENGLDERRPQRAAPNL
jgi:hypothetical protein